MIVRIVIHVFVNNKRARITGEQETYNITTITTSHHYDWAPQHNQSILVRVLYFIAKMYPLINY